jgi:hypothetical protein
MKKFYILFFLLLTTIAFSQEDAWVYFNAKPNSQFYFDSPLEMLSQRALDRRTKQNIAIDFKDVPLEPSYVSQVEGVSGISVMAKSKWLNAIHVRGTQALINSLKTFSFVAKVDFANKSLNSAGKIAKTHKNQEQNKIEKAKVDFTYGTSANQIQMLNGHLLHQQNFTGSGKIIAIMDGGFPGVNTALPFKRLRDNNQILGGYDYVNRNEDFYVGDNHVEESLWVEAVEKADMLGVDIINTSLGYFEFDNPAYNHTYSEMNGISAFMSRGAEIAFSRGMIIVAAAGNEGATSDPYIAVPADAVSVIAVGAVNATKTRTSFSSIGPSYDGRIKPDIMAQGQAAILSNELGDIITANGTSFSSPIMAGMVACLWQAFPTKTNQEIRQLIIQSGDKFASPNNQYGYGIPNFSSALSNGLFVNEFSKNYFTAYPNPTTNFVTLTFPDSFNKGKVVFYTILGQKVLEKNVIGQMDNISLESLSKGTYFYQIESDVFSKNGKIIKQ